MPLFDMPSSPPHPQVSNDLILITSFLILIHLFFTFPLFRLRIFSSSFFLEYEPTNYNLSHMSNIKVFYKKVAFWTESSNIMQYIKHAGKPPELPSYIWGMQAILWSQLDGLEGRIVFGTSSCHACLTFAVYYTYVGYGTFVFHSSGSQPKRLLPPPFHPSTRDREQGQSCTVKFFYEIPGFILTKLSRDCVLFMSRRDFYRIIVPI